MSDDNKPINPALDTEAGVVDKPQDFKNVPQSKIEDGNNKRKVDSKQMQKRKHAIKISNLSERTTFEDLEELVKHFGTIQKRYLAKDKKTNVCKGFAFVNFKSRGDAARAIAALNGHVYDNLMLSVDWSIPPAQNEQL